MKAHTLYTLADDNTRYSPCPFDMDLDGYFADAAT